MDVEDDDVLATVEDWGPVPQEMATYLEYFLDVDGRQKLKQTSLLKNQKMIHQETYDELNERLVTK